MLQPMDLASLAEGIDTPYLPQPLVALEALEAALFVSQDKRSWHRNEAQDQLLFVLEGVITLDGPTGQTVIVNEGELCAVPAKLGHIVASGMRSSVVLVTEQPVPASANGRPAPPFAQRSEIDKANVAVQVHQNALFDWQQVGAVGGYTAHATRLWGSSVPYPVPEGSMLLLVFRGVLDYRTRDVAGSVVGSQLLAVPAGTSITFDSERGATVLALVRAGTALPEPARPAAAETGLDRSDGPPSA